MFVPLRIFAVLALATLCSAAPYEVETKDIEEFLKDLISQGNNMIASKRNSVISLPDFGTFPKDPFTLRNGRLGNFSSLELRGHPSLVKEVKPDGSTIILLDLTIAIAEFNMQYDFSLRYFEKPGNLMIRSNHTAVRFRASLTRTSRGGCKGSLVSAEVERYNSFDVIIKQDDSDDELAKFDKELSSKTASFLIPHFNLALKSFLDNPEVQESFSKASCQAISGYVTSH